MEFQSDHNDSESDKPIAIRCLEEVGISKSDIQKLETAGYHTVQSVFCSTRKSLTKIKGISDAKADRLLTASKSLLPKMPSPPLPPPKPLSRIPTGNSKIDFALQGGIETGCLTEIFGEFKSGKTYLCHQLCVSCQRTSRGAVALYIDCDGKFSPNLISTLAEQNGMNAEEVLDNIQYARAVNSDQLDQVLIQASQLAQQLPVKVLVLDGFSFFKSQTARGELASRATYFAKLLRWLYRLADEHDIAVVKTTHTVPRTDSRLIVGRPIVVDGARLELKRDKGGNRICEVYTADDHTTVTFQTNEDEADEKEIIMPF